MVHSHLAASQFLVIQTQLLCNVVISPDDPEASGLFPCLFPSIRFAFVVKLPSPGEEVVTAGIPCFFPK